jgi:hypothetical protein
VIEIWIDAASESAFTYVQLIRQSRTIAPHGSLFVLPRPSFLGQQMPVSPSDPSFLVPIFPTPSSLLTRYVATERPLLIVAEGFMVSIARHCWQHRAAQLERRAPLREAHAIMSLDDGFLQDELTEMMAVGAVSSVKRSQQPLDAVLRAHRPMLESSLAQRCFVIGESV